RRSVAWRGWPRLQRCGTRLRRRSAATVLALARAFLPHFCGAQRIFGFRDDLERLHLARLIDFLADDPLELLAGFPEKSYPGQQLIHIAASRRNERVPVPVSLPAKSHFTRAE